MPVVVNESDALPTLEPLSDATGQMISPLPLSNGDFFRVRLTKAGTHFVITPISLRRLDRDEETDEDVIEHSGLRFVRSKYPASQASHGIRSRIPECKQEGPSYHCAATDITALVMHHLVPHVRLIWEDDETRDYFMFLLLRFLKQVRSARITSAYKMENAVPEMPDDFLEHESRPLMPHQRAAFMASLCAEAYSLFMEQGTGKTAVCINRVNYEAALKRAGRLPHRPDRTEMYRCLVICPKQLRLNWHKEFENFSTVTGKVTALRGGLLNRARRLIKGISEEEDCAWGTVILPYDSVESMLEYLMRVDWDLVIFDESHYVKNPNSKRFAAAKKLRNFPLVHQSMVLTGTPMANTVMDLYSQLELTSEGMSGFSSFAAFRQFYGVFKRLDRMDGSSINQIVGMKNVPLLQERLIRVAFMLTKKQARLNLPDKMYDVIEVQMTPKQRSAYKEMSEFLTTQIGDLDDDTVSADHILTMLLRLAQITSGFVKYDVQIDPVTMETIGAAREEQIDKKNPKIEAVVEMLTDEGRDPNGKTIIWCCFKHDIRVISERLAQEGIGHRTYFGETSDNARQEAYHAFNWDPECRVMIGNPATMGEGLNLVGYDWDNPDGPKQETYTDHEIFFSQNWSATQRSQAEDRAHRKGTRQPVRITDLCVPGTIDEEIRERVTRKIQNAMSLQDVRAVMKRVLGHEPEED